ncbi:hypothetical protein J437_LFUL009243 [Ladona fulva]|uniref:NADH dehydrogenase [ubiquinone] 1 alpha subcomplex subunit 7 n=1 Tax=Ladona fulva TaxID=123851 RepID=A0A8K0P9B6_LADFU|nr:hypothetical protein J437_LFUL009243 [Ladona fulva]
MAKVEPRNVAPLLQKIRNFLIGREMISALRFEDWLSNRTQPPPNLPDGSAHKLSANYYYTRDGRREVKHPTLIADVTSRKAIASPQSSSKELSAFKKLPTPGEIFKWD